jgi:N-acetylglutamate synthase-like GNAT family acetyltransferase
VTPYVAIVVYEPTFQTLIDDMMIRIQLEFEEKISSPQSTKLYEAYLLPDQKYWVASYSGKIIGTAGVVLLSNGNCVLKRMMVDPAYRGNEKQVAKQLLDQCMLWAREQHAKYMYLGTMAQFIAAQKFYQKNGFTEISTSQMPADAVLNPIDALYYSRKL